MTTMNETRTYSVNECIGITVNQYLFDQRITKTRLAQALGVAQTNASKKVRGNVTWSAQDLLVTANLLGVTVQDLLPTSDGHGGWVPAVFRPGQGKGPDRSRSGPLSVAGAGFEPTTSGFYVRFIDLDGEFVVVA